MSYDHKLLLEMPVNANCALRTQSCLHVIRLPRTGVNAPPYLAQRGWGFHYCTLNEPVEFCSVVRHYLMVPGTFSIETGSIIKRHTILIGIKTKTIIMMMV